MIVHAHADAHLRINADVRQLDEDLALLYVTRVLAVLHPEQALVKLPERLLRKYAPLVSNLTHLIIIQ